MQKLVVLGLGRMGLPIAVRLASAADVVGVDVDPDRRALAAAAGVPVASSEASVRVAVGGADVVVPVLTGAAVERAVLLGDGRGGSGSVGSGGLLSAMRGGALLLELTSGDPALSTDLLAAARSRGIRYVAAPMAGGPADAKGGTLGFFLGGAADDLAAAEDLLAPLGERRMRIGDEPAHAQTAKLLVNALWFGQAALVGEAVALGVRAGIDATLLQRVLAASAAGSAFVDEYLPRALAGDDLPSFGVTEIVEELRAATSLAHRLGTPAALLDGVARVHERALATFGPVDGELIAIRLAADEAGVRFGA